MYTNHICIACTCKNIREILIQLVACTKLMNLEENQKDLMCMIIETSVMVVQNNFRSPVQNNFAHLYEIILLTCTK